MADACGGGIILRSIIIDNELWFPEQVAYEDNPVGIFHYFLSKKIVYIDKDYYYYRCNNQSTTRAIRINDKSVLDRLETTELLISNAKRLGLYSKYKDLFDTCYIRLLAGNTPLMFLFSYRPMPVKHIRDVFNMLSSIDPNWRTHKYYKPSHGRLLSFYLDYLLPTCIPLFGYPIQLAARLRTIIRKLKK